MTTKRLIHTTTAALLLLGATRAFSAAGLPYGGFTNTPIVPGTPWHVHDPFRPQPKVITPGASFSQMAAPPSDATVLFDGKDMSQWERDNGGPPGWKLQDGYMEIVPRMGDLRTKGAWADFQLHLEFAEPAQVESSSQGRGNSGIMVNGMYEIQVLDSYNNLTYADGMVGALYGQEPPLANAARPPGEWQCYDIIFESPRWDTDGKLTKKAAVTVLLNGIVLHNRHEYIGTTDGSARGVPYRSLSAYRAPHAPEMFIQLQNHNGNAVRYRNIWIRSMGEYDKPAGSEAPAAAPAAPRAGQ